MREPIDEYFASQVALLGESVPPGSWEPAHPPTPEAASANAARLWGLFEAQATSRHLDFAARRLRALNLGFYTIGSAGHESNAAVAMALRPTDPALLHYRSGGFYAARAAQVPGSDAVRDVLHGLANSRDDPISGGRHKVFGHPGLAVIPQTSTIASHLPRAVGLAYGLDRRAPLSVASSWPDDAVVVCSLGDASINHSTATGAFNAAAYLTHRGVALPLLVVCEDNGLGISTPSPVGWVERSLRGYGLDYLSVAGTDVPELLATCDEAARRVRSRRQPTVLHLRTVRFMGHAGSDAESGYRRPGEITADFARDPLLATARTLQEAGVEAPEILERYERIRARVMQMADTMDGVLRLTSAAEVMEPLTARKPVEVSLAARRGPGPNADAGSSLTLAQTINRALADAMQAHPQTLLFGEDVAVKGGVYGVTRGLRKQFGGRVFDTMLDEQTILGTALGTALAGFVPIPEIQYLAYLHNAEDQLRGEAASLRFFSAGQYGNGMVVRVAGLAYQKGFGGHFHNDNAVAVLRDIPGIVVGVPAHPADAAGMLRTCLGLAIAEQRVCVLLEPIARYHTRDLHQDGDKGWLAPYQSASEWNSRQDGLGRCRMHGSGKDLLIITYGNGLFLSLRAVEQLRRQGVSCTVLDLRWLAPLPEAEFTHIAEGFDAVLVVDECRRSGGIAEPVIAMLADARYDGAIARVTSADSFVPLGPAADLVLLNEEDIINAALELLTEN
ncbi:MAG: thiamine pyrophosphate-dependent enzyme [Actinomycetales bacterium]